MHLTTLPAPRSMLFVSGEQSARFPKAFAAGADLVCIDLEDAVHPERKTEARSRVIDWLAALPPRRAGESRRALRLNSLRSVDGLRDALALLDSGVSVDWLLLPKVEHAADVQLVAGLLGAQIGAIVALIETPLGIENAFNIARAGASSGGNGGMGKLGALMLGGADLSAELDAEFGWTGLLSARGRLVNAAKAAGLQAWDVPNVDLQNPDALLTETRQARALGFDCKTAIHPQQIAGIHAAFAPTAAECAWAALLIEAVPAGQSSGAFLFQGRMVDAPLLRKARRIDELARLSAS